MTTKPIRVGLLGLSTRGWAPLAHLPYLISSPKYELVAICNSSVESARAAIEAYKLPAGTRAYGDAQDLANDPAIDLVVCSVRVDRHLQTITPSILAQKDIYVEWPLGASLAQAETLHALAQKHGTRLTAVGLQGRYAPAISKLKELIKEGRVGRVLSSTWVGYATNGGPTESEAATYIADRGVGGNLLTIHFGHTVDYVQQVLGTFKSAKSILANRRPLINILKKDGSVAVKDYPKTSDDTIFVQGISEKDDVPVSLALRGGKAFKGTPGMDWRIYGDKAEIRITASGPFLQIGYPDVLVSVHDLATDTVEEVDVGRDEFEELGLPARNVGRVYEAIAAGGKDGVLVDFGEAVERHRFLEQLYKENGIVV